MYFTRLMTKQNIGLQYCPAIVSLFASGPLTLKIPFLPSLMIQPIKLDSSRLSQWPNHSTSFKSPSWQHSQALLYDNQQATALFVISSRLLNLNNLSRRQLSNPSIYGIPLSCKIAYRFLFFFSPHRFRSTILFPLFFSLHAWGV